MNESKLEAFVIESNRIEGITRPPTDDEIDATREFLALDRISIEDMERFVSACARGATLRIRAGMNVSIGNHVPALGGPGIGYALGGLLVRASEGADPFAIHVEYETLHPFMDGNGRSGRVLWAWMMGQQNNRLLALGFLHAFYYQALSAQRAAYARGFAEAREACEKAAVEYGNRCLDHSNDMDEQHSKRDRTGWRDQAIAVGELALKLRALKPAVKP